MSGKVVSPKQGGRDVPTGKPEVEDVRVVVTPSPGDSKKRSPKEQKQRRKKNEDDRKPLMPEVSSSSEEEEGIPDPNSLDVAVTHLWEAGRRMSHRVLDPIFTSKKKKKKEGEDEEEEEEEEEDAAHAAKAAAVISVRALGQHFLDARNRMKKSPWIVSLIVCFCCVAIFCAGIFDLIFDIISLHLIRVIWKLYEVLFAALTFLAETTRYLSIFGSRKLVSRWLPLLELNVGRGCLQILTAGLALTEAFRLGESVPALLLICTGIYNIVWGVRAALKVRRLFAKLKESLHEEHKQRQTDYGTAGSSLSVEGLQQEGGGEKLLKQILTPQQLSPADDSTAHASLLLMQKKFAALDLNGDGRVSKEELSLGCRSLNLKLTDEEIEIIFQLLDPRKKGYITIEAFESWWYSEHSPAAFLV